jgi:hypothetical protein
MSNFVWCHGPSCHKSHTQDRIRGVKGSKVLRTKKIKQVNTEHVNFYNYFCSQGCYNDFAHKYVREVIAIAPRTEALETPIDVETFTRTDYFGNPYTTKEIKEVDNNGG